LAHPPRFFPQGQNSAAFCDAPEDCDPLTANTLSARLVCFELHSGQAIESLDDIDFTSFSKRCSHFLQTYSYMGMDRILTIPGEYANALGD